MRLLILGGTTEASALARALAGRPEVVPLLSLAGRTALPAPAPIPVRTGGFGGADGLAAFLAAESIGAVIDATHPFAVRISAHAAAACARRGVPLARFTRPPWSPEPGDDWRPVRDLDGAADAIGPESRRVLLTSGRLGLASFRRAPHHAYVLRSIDLPNPEDRPPACELVLARGPFGRAGEEALMRAHRIDILVSKNSGGSRAKLDAARALGLPVVMVERPPEPAGPEPLADLAEVLRWIEAHWAAP